MADVVDEKRDELFGELVRAVVVGAIRDDRRHAVSVVERAHEVVGASLRSGIRAVRSVLRRFVEEVVTVGQVMFGTRCRRGERRRNAFRMVHLQCAVDFVGRNVVETLAFILFGEAFPVEFCSLEQGESAHHVRLSEGERVLDGAVHVAFGGQVNDAVDFFVLHKLIKGVKIADIHLYELVVRLVFDVLEVCKVTRISELIEVDNLVFRILIHKQTDHVATNEACAASNNDGSFHIFLRLRLI